MTRGELVGVVALSGMVVSILCLESDFAIPALILALAFGIIAFASRLLADEGFLDSKEIDADRIRQNRDRVWKQWVSGGKVK